MEEKELIDYAKQVEKCVQHIQKMGYTLEQAIKITDIASKNILSDVLSRTIEK